MPGLERFKKINGNTLKLIACITMFIDHLAAGIIRPVINNGLYDGDIPFETISRTYEIMKGIGRSAFPIFCFLLVEGFIHTKNRLRYALSLLIFGIISEPFFDITFYAAQEVVNPNIISALHANSEILNDHCNVYFTLFIGLLTIWLIHASYELVKKLSGPIEFAFALSALATSLGIFIAEKLHTDYHGYGVGLIVIFYFLSYNEPLNLITGYCEMSVLRTEYLSFPGFLLMFLYNKKRGRSLGKLKYVFYAFYPAHIYLIYRIRCLLFG
ncbi:MAG: hypothetical protein IJU77_05395 [Butyrivibrio sp.]|nr:hypothetical protein [Butyrivibrio sp.]